MPVLRNRQNVQQPARYQPYNNGRYDNNGRQNENRRRREARAREERRDLDGIISKEKFRKQQKNNCKDEEVSIFFSNSCFDFEFFLNFFLRLKRCHMSFSTFP